MHMQFVKSSDCSKHGVLIWFVAPLKKFWMRRSAERRAHTKGIKPQRRSLRSGWYWASGAPAGQEPGAGPEL